MTDSSSFTSLLALVDSHLSKTSVQESRSEDASVSNRIPIPSLTSKPGTLSETRMAYSPGQRLPIPRFDLGDSPIQSILAEQVANMLKAKELKRQQEEEKEKQRLTEEVAKIKIKEDEDDSVIDLMQALLPHGAPLRRVPSDEVASISSSLESLFEPKFIDCDSAPERLKSPEPLLPCIQDMSYILKQKVHKGKCSPFGRVLTARLRPVAAPYFKEKINSDIKVFEFDTPSPCDIIKEKMRRPTMNATFVPDIINMFKD